MMKKSGSVNFKRRKLAGIIGILLAASAACRLLVIGTEYFEGPAVYRSLRRSFVTDAKVRRIPGGTDSAGGAVPKTEDEKPAQNESESADASTGADDGTVDYRSVQIDFSCLKGINEDIIGWLMFDGNGISYPVLQGTDNRKYLYTLADKTQNDAGSIFMDSLCAPDFEDPHTILYGHNRKDGTMFGKLKLYAADPSYYEKNRFFTVYTPDGYFRYEIFAWYETAEDDIVYQAGFAADKTFTSFAEQLLKRGNTDTLTTVGMEDKIITLSTCSSAGKRFVVHGKRMGGKER